MAPARTGTLTGVALAFGAYASWGLLSPVGKHLLGSDGHAGTYLPLGLNFVRFALATVVLLVAIGPGSTRTAVHLLRRGDVWWVNVLANASLTLFLYSLERLPQATYATLGFYTAPLWTALLARWMLNEHPGPWFLPAVAALLAGGYLTLFGFAPPPPGFDAFGMTLAIASGLVWAYYSVDLRKSAPDLALKPLMGASFLIGTLWYGLPALLVEGPPALLHQDATTWAWMALYVAIPTLASFILFNAALQRTEASLVNLLVGAELGFTALFATVLFGDRFGAVQCAGLVLVLAAVTAYLWERRRAATPSPK